MPADVLISEQNAAAPALSATSDMPVVALPETPAPPDSPAPEPAAPSEPDGNTGQEVPADGGEAEPAAAEPAERPGRDQRQRSPETARERFSDMAAQRKAAEQRADRLADIAERLAGLVAANQQRPAEVNREPPPPPAAEPKPRRETFDAPEAYDDALVTWSTRQATRIAQAEFEAKAAQDRAAAEQDAQRYRERERFDAEQREWSDRRTQALERMPDYVDVAERDDVPISTSMALIIRRSEQGPEIAYHLGKHPDEAARIAAMVVPGQYFPQGHPAAGEPLPDVQRQLFELGRIAAIAAAPRPEVSRAPAPIKPLGSNGAARQKTTAEMTTEEYAAYRMPQLQAERRPGMLGVPVDQVRRPQ